jgi:hypothetical protein
MLPIFTSIPSYIYLYVCGCHDVESRRRLPQSLRAPAANPPSSSPFQPSFSYRGPHGSPCNGTGAACDPLSKALRWRFGHLDNN